MVNFAPGLALSALISAMGQFLLILLLLFALIAWALYSFFSPVIKVFRQAYGAGHDPRRANPFGEQDAARDGTREEGEAVEQSSVDLIHETNMDLEGGEYVDYEELKEH